MVHNVLDVVAHMDNAIPREKETEKSGVQSHLQLHSKLESGLGSNKTKSPKSSGMYILSCLGAWLNTVCVAKGRVPHCALGATWKRGILFVLKVSSVTGWKVDSTRKGLGRNSGSICA